MNKKNLILIIGVLLVGLFISLAGATTHYGSTFSSGSTFGQSYTGGFSGPTNYWQTYQPTFSRLYSGDSRNIWPILKRMETDQCNATNDFIIGIPPGGCSPAVVRSDLLAEQNVPVFCQLYAIKVNPLIKVSSIRTISFKGDYPEGVSGISFHPARAAVRSYRTLLGDPVLNNIGYVVIILKKNRIEEDLEEWIAGNLTATIRYDAEKAYGAGRSEYYLSTMEDDKWGIDHSLSSFFAGKGYVRLLDRSPGQINIGRSKGQANIGIYSGKDNLIKKVSLQEGETSSVAYLPGYYCRAGVKIRLNKFVTPEDSALLNIDGNELWVRRGTGILNNKCKVNNLDVNGIGNGTVSIRCPGDSFTLSLSPLEKNNSEEDLIESPSESSDEYFKEGEKTVNELIEKYGSELKESGREAYGEEALYEQIVLASKIGKFKSQKALMDLFLENYPSSKIIDKIRSDRINLGTYSYEKSTKKVFVTGEFHSIGVKLFKDEEEGTSKATVDLRVEGVLEKDKKVNEKIRKDSKISISRISLDEIDFIYSNKRGSNKKVTIGVGKSKNIDSLEVEVLEIKGFAATQAHISIIPEVKRTKTEAEFTFKIGIEKRAIKLSTKKINEMLKNLNESIENWENINSRLKKTITAWKGACFATSGYLTIKNVISGFSGESIARQKMMVKYKKICDIDYKSLTRTQCYNELSDEIDSDVSLMKEAINSVNSVMDDNIEKHKTSEGLFVEGSIVNQQEYVKDLKKNLGDGWSTVIDGIEITSKDLNTAAQVRMALLDKELGGEGNADIAAKEELEIKFRNLAHLKKNKDIAKSSQKSLNTLMGGTPNVAYSQIKNSEVIPWGGQKFGEFNEGNGINGVEDVGVDKNIQVYLHSDGILYLLILGGIEKEFMGAEQIYKEHEGSFVKLDDKKIIGEIRKVNFASQGSLGTCKYNWLPGTAKLSFYDSGRNRGLPAIIPFDLVGGWYAMVPNSGGTFLEDVPQGYTASADVNYFKICSIGPNHIMEKASGDDLCQTFSIHTAGKVNKFIPCPNLGSSEVSDLYLKAREAIRQASQQYGQDSFNILGSSIGKGDPMSLIGGLECQDFMSPTDCKLMFNVCDPVICPSSRCDLGGRMPVSNVVQTGIVGSLALCLPNSAEGIVVPICLTGVHAGLESFVSLLDSERACLQENLETGKMVGICDEITSVYKCEFFWRQLAPVTNLIIPATVSKLYGGEQRTRGGGEYLSIQSAWKNLGKNINFFRDTYAASTFKAFKLRNVEEAGGEVCKSFIGTSFPTSADALDSLLEPESPAQFYAQFSDIPFSEATVPATSHYKVYFHIYAGNDIGSNFRIYLKSPPVSTYYRNNPILQVKSGYIPRGSSVDESIDFTAPTGYKELCVVIGAQEECGFKSVTSSYAVNYVRAKYTEDQAIKGGITSESECISGSPSGLSLANFNLGEGLSGVIDPEIGLRGITRVCASNNPDIGVRSTSDWIDVGYCGEENLRCWLDLKSVESDLESIAAVENSTISLLEKQRSLIENTKSSYGQVREIISSVSSKIGKLSSEDLRNPEGKKISGLKEELDNVIGTDEVLGSGTNSDKAEALSLKATIYRLIVLEEHKGGIPKSKQKVARPKYLEDSNVKVEESLISGDTITSCQIEIGEKIIEISKGIKSGSNIIDDKEVKENTGIENFECLVLQLAMQESSLRHCENQNEAKDCFICNEDGSNENLRSGDEGKSLGVMQINTDVHKKVNVNDFEANINYGIKRVLLLGYSSFKVGKLFEPLNKKYSGWQAALRSYNGWGYGGDDDFVETVLGREEELKDMFPEACDVEIKEEPREAYEAVDITSAD